MEMIKTIVSINDLGKTDLPMIRALRVGLLLLWFRKADSQ
jgi:hypothetical protein